MVRIVEHPLVRMHLTALRNRETSAQQFRIHMAALARLLAYPVFENLTCINTCVTTPMTTTVGYQLDKPPVLVPILRAGLGLVDALLELVPNAVVSHLGMYRDHDTLLPVRYYSNFPGTHKSHPFVVLDPMLATGGSAQDALDYLKQEGVQDIRLVCVLAAPEGIKHLSQRHPDVDIFTASIDERLNESGYIIPGLGDAGDRQFGTL